MEFKSELIDDVMVLRLSGDLIGEDGGFSLLELVNDTTADNIIKCVVDISELRYINSSGIGVLITILTKFRNRDGEVYLVNPSDSVKKLLIITKLNAIFNVSDSVENAIQAFKNN
jgi:anti-sigma B factor antagonist